MDGNVSIKNIPNEEFYDRYEQMHMSTESVLKYFCMNCDIFPSSISNLL